MLSAACCGLCCRHFSHRTNMKELDLGVMMVYMLRQSYSQHNRRRTKPSQTCKLIQATDTAASQVPMPTSVPMCTGYSPYALPSTPHSSAHASAKPLLPHLTHHRETKDNRVGNWLHAAHWSATTDSTQTLCLKPDSFPLPNNPPRY
jgi:hypothetical protein